LEVDSLDWASVPKPEGGTRIEILIPLSASAEKPVTVRLVRETPRERHTRIGWSLMTHERGGPAGLGAGALIMLVTDLVYSWSH